ncbi:hypothetical protein EC973_009485 [Apophysomyces ossiformis]|uniref:Nascent polypeptide-associated complex subunit alpha-like UBA domain-containing protein n=1 Tax=Apophysomyces ossiformis TaxID=679940 RepID=A0A8H7EP41_9FUNG|nr:hypothetical protein EC973_009485 [Apophysomyces ossiformis]
MAAQQSKKDKETQATKEQERNGRSVDANEDQEDTEPVEKGVKGEATKDMKNVTNYLNEELANRQSLSFLQEAAKMHKTSILNKNANAGSVNRQDVEFLVTEMRVSKIVAEKALRDNKGDVVAALNQLIEG